MAGESSFVGRVLEQHKWPYSMCARYGGGMNENFHDADETEMRLRDIEAHMRAMLNGDSPPYDAGIAIWAKAMSATNSDVLHAMWLIWGSLTDWVENRPAETQEAEAAMLRAAGEWLALAEPSSRKAYLDRWVYDECGYQRAD